MSSVVPARSAIGRDESAYRKGMVPGLTMAEIMLLLVFCLLIAAAVIFKEDRKNRDQLNARLAASETALAAERKEIVRQTQEMTHLKRLAADSGRSQEEVRELDDEWRRLVASDEVVTRMRSAGLSPDKVAADAKDIVALTALTEDGTSIAEIAAAVTDAERSKSGLSTDDELTNLPPAELARLAKLGMERARTGEGEHDWPPIINLSEAKGYSFSVGSAELSSEFAQLLRSRIADDVVGNIERYRANVVEVIGHTDEQAMAPRPSNLDRNLVSVLAGKASISTLFPGDNAGLGMARAVSVAGVLRRDPRFANVTVLPLSGGQMILPGDQLTDGSTPGDSRERRRIEIRVRRPEQATVSTD